MVFLVTMDFNLHQIALTVVQLLYCKEFLQPIFFRFNNKECICNTLLNPACDLPIGAFPSVVLFQRHHLREPPESNQHTCTWAMFTYPLPSICVCVSG